MPALYATIVIVGGWMALAVWGPLHRVDPYPFPFMLFLGNVGQLLLCFVILVGQRVLGRAAHRRAIETHAYAKAIFEEVSGLREHLMRQDRMLNRGASLKDWEEPPWVEWWHVLPPQTAREIMVDASGRLAAWLTERAGSMWAFYGAAAFQLGWMGLAEAGVIRFDPYPFAFLLFLSSLAQLLLMFVIMVGQDVLGRAGDWRAEQTHTNAQAILFECRSMKEHLTAQDWIIESMSDHVRATVVEHLARAMHATRLAARTAAGERMRTRASLVPWRELPEEFRESNRDQARHAAEMLAIIGCVVLPRSGPAEAFEYRGDDIERLSRMEHERWVRERERQGFVFGPERAGRHHPDMAPWEDLSEEARAKDIQFVSDLPRMLNEAGFQLVRLSGG